MEGCGQVVSSTLMDHCAEQIGQKFGEEQCYVCLGSLEEKMSQVRPEEGVRLGACAQINLPARRKGKHIFTSIAIQNVSL